MKSRLQKIVQIIKMSRRQNVSLRRRMMLYLVAMSLVAVGVLFLILVGCGLILNGEDQMTQMIQNRLESVSSQLESDMENLEGYSLNLARQLSRSMEYQMEYGELSMSEFNDSPEKLLELQRMIYGDMNATLLMSGASGVFTVTDATVNTGLEGAEHSRSGLYLRANSIGQGVPIVPDPILFRGSAEIAREKGLELHSRWNLEFETDLLPGYQQLMGACPNTTEDLFWIGKMRLRDTWEDVLLLCTPIKGSVDSVYGICGLELNELYFRNKYPVQESECGTMITVIAPLENDKLHLERGMLGNTEGTWLEGTEVLTGDEGKKYYTFSSENGDFIGLVKRLNISAVNGQSWTATVLVSKDSGMAYIRRSRGMLMIAVAVFVGLMILLVTHMSQQFVQPILQSIDDIKGNGSTEITIVRPITELEELKSFLKSRNESQKLDKLPDNIEEMLQDFKSRVETLTPTERVLLNYYIEDYTLEEIAEKMFISIGTAKKHNTNMNRKLEILSRSQLMVYIELFKRCDRLDDIIKVE